MGLNITQKLINSHLVKGNPVKGEEIAIRIDQTLTQDATGTMAYLQFEAMGIDRVKTELSLSYIDHNTLQSGFMNADDHKYIQTACKKFGVYYSKPGNGICHQIHLERFGKPGKSLVGSDSHTPTGGGICMLAIGVGGLDVAVAMGGGEFYLNMPSVTKVELTGKLRPMVSAKDVILKLLSVLSVKGGVGKVIEYAGEGVMSLSVPERATITNMGAELGATTGIFPSDENTRAFLKAQNREEDYVEIKADDDAEYDEIIKIDLSEIEPLVACPHMPDNVKEVKAIEGMKIDQVCIGSCTNSSFTDLMKVAAILKGRKVADDVSLVISPGSRQVLTMLSENGAVADILASGARLLECSCGPCIGMGQSPKSAGVSLRTFNRNFEGRSGTADGQIYLVSPETAAWSAVCGCLTVPSRFANEVNVDVKLPEYFKINDNMIIEPSKPGENVEIVRGPNIKPFPRNTVLPDNLDKKAVLKVGDNITTDHIMPAGSKILPYRSNVPYLSQFCFEVCDKTFPARAQEWGGGFIIGGANYGQGSSREHAALVPLYLGIKAVITKSFARIHKANLINSGILPLTFENPDDYDNIKQGDDLIIPDIRKKILGGEKLTMINKTNGKEIPLVSDFSERQRAILAAGGLLNFTASK